MGKNLSNQFMYTFSELSNQEDFNIRVTRCKNYINTEDFLKVCEKSLGNGIVCKDDYYIVALTFVYNDIFGQRKKQLQPLFIPGNDIIRTMRNFEYLEYTLGVRIEINKPTQESGLRVWLIIR